MDGGNFVPPPPAADSLTLHRLCTENVPAYARMQATENTKHLYLKMIADKNGLKAALRQRRIDISQYRRGGRDLGKQFQARYCDEVRETERMLQQARKQTKEARGSGTLYFSATPGESKFFVPRRRKENKKKRRNKSFVEPGLTGVPQGLPMDSSKFALVATRLHPITPSSRSDRHLLS